MSSTLNISISEEQEGWLNARRETGGFASASDVVHELIRSRQEQEQARLLEQFRSFKGDGGDEAEPVASVVAVARKVKKERRAQAVCRLG